MLPSARARRGVRAAPLLALGLAVVGATAGSPSATRAAEPKLAEPKLAERGRALLERECAGCHAVAPPKPSPLAGAPEFRTLVTTYGLERLAGALAEGVVRDHPVMPPYAFSSIEVAAILAYLETIADGATVNR
jgi:mono/diheme cytochrome c family protein